MQKDNIQNKNPAENIASKDAFAGYPSIELSTRDKFIKVIKEEGYDKPDVLWVASEKIHGSNFSIHYNGKDKVARYGRRTDFISQETPVPCEDPGKYMTESFLNSKQTVKKFHNSLPDIFETVTAKYPQAEVIKIYGEYFGGLWPKDHPDYVKGPKQVQPGISYTPNHEFMVFDIKIITGTQVFWANVTDIPALLNGKIMHVPIYAKGTFEEIYAIDTVIDSTIPELLGLHKLDKNIIEGMVLRPNENKSSEKYGQRIILKKKNADFLQKSSKPAAKEAKEKKQKPLDPAIAPFIQQLAQYINFNRIESVTSKYPELKDRNKLKGLIFEDAIADAVKDEYKSPQSEEDKKKVKVELEKLIMKQINSYYIKH